MPGNWRYALEPLPVDLDLEKLARAMLPRRIAAEPRGNPASRPGDPAGERMRRIVNALRTRVTEPDPEAQGPALDEDPSRRN